MERRVARVPDVEDEPVLLDSDGERIGAGRSADEGEVVRFEKVEHRHLPLAFDLPAAADHRAVVEHDVLEPACAI